MVLQSRFNHLIYSLIVILLVSCRDYILCYWLLLLGSEPEEGELGCHIGSWHACWGCIIAVAAHGKACIKNRLPGDDLLLCGCLNIIDIQLSLFSCQRMKNKFLDHSLQTGRGGILTCILLNGSHRVMLLSQR